MAGLVRNILFHGALLAAEQSAKDRLETLRAVISDPPYITRWNTKLSKSEHGLANLTDVIPFVKLISAVMDIGLGGKMFSSFLNFNSWYEVWMHDAEVVVRNEDVVCEVEDLQS